MGTVGEVRHLDGKAERHVCEECAALVDRLETELRELKADVRLAVQALSGRS